MVPWVIWYPGLYGILCYIMVLCVKYISKLFPEKKGGKKLKETEKFCVGSAKNSPTAVVTISH